MRTASEQSENGNLRQEANQCGHEGQGVNYHIQMKSQLLLLKQQISKSIISKPIVLLEVVSLNLNSSTNRTLEHVQLVFAPQKRKKRTLRQQQVPFRKTPAAAKEAVNEREET